jgi:hypothetical protein
MLLLLLHWLLHDSSKIRDAHANGAVNRDLTPEICQAEMGESSDSAWDCS